MLYLAVSLLLFAVQGVPVDLLLEKDEFTDEATGSLFGLGKNEELMLLMACRKTGEAKYGLVLALGKLPDSRKFPSLKPSVSMGVDFRFDDGPIEVLRGSVGEDRAALLVLHDEFVRRLADHDRLRLRARDSDGKEFVEDFDISKVTSDKLVRMCSQTSNPFRSELERRSKQE